jgi:hypothetical protein
MVIASISSEYITKVSLPSQSKVIIHIIRVGMAAYE